jgi:hypothetical protein
MSHVTAALADWETVTTRKASTDATSASATRDLLSFTDFIDVRRSSLLRTGDGFFFDIDDSLFWKCNQGLGSRLCLMCVVL